MIISQDDIIIRVRVDGEDAYPRLQKQSAALGKGTATLGSRMAELGQIVTGVESGLALAARAAGTAKRAFDAVSVPVGLAIQFEQQFAQVRTLTDKAGADLERGLLDLAARVPQTAGDITQAAYQAISAGIDPSDAVAFLDAASKTAVAGATSLTTSVDLLTSAANAYKIQGVDAARASDVLFATVRAGKTTIDELAQSIGQAAPAAAQFGVRIEELGASAAVLTKQGLSTAEAMTRINALTKALVNPSKAAASKLKALGVEFGAAALKSKGLTAILQDLRDKTQGNDEALATLFTRFEATQAVVGLLGDGLKGYNSDLKSITDSTGAVSSANDIMAGTVQGAIDRFQALKEGVLRDVGQELLPLFNEGLAELSTWVEANSDDIVAFARDLADGLIAIGRWAADDGPAVVKALGAAFVASKLSTAAVALAGIRAQLVAIGPAAAAAAGGVGPLLSGALRSPGVVGVAVGAAVFLGQAIGNAVGESMTAEFRSQASQLDAEVKLRTDAVKKMLRDARGFDAMGDFQGAKGTLASGRGLLRTVGAGVTAENLTTVSGLLSEGAEEGLVKAIVEENKERLRGLQAKSVADQVAIGQQLTAALRAGDRGEVEALNGQLAKLREQEKGLAEGINNLSSTLALALAEQRDAARKKPPRKPLKPRKPAADAPAPTLLEDGPLAGLFGSVAGGAAGASDLLADGLAGADSFMSRLAAAEQTNAERRAMLIEDGTQRELALAQLRYQQEVTLAEQAGQDVNLVTQLYARERQQILTDAADMERESWLNAASEALGSAEQILGSFQALAGGSKAMNAIIIAARAADYQTKAIGLGADALAAGASGNIPAAIGFGAAAVAAEAAAIQHFAKAAGLGGGGGGGGRSGGGASGARSAGVGGAPRARASDGFSGGGGGGTVTFNITTTYMDQDGADRLAERLVPALNNVTGRRGGLRLNVGGR